MKKCCFCDSTTTVINGVYCCEECKVVLFASGKSDDDICSEVIEYIQRIDIIRKQNRYKLHDLLQKKINAESISKEDSEVIDFYECFLDISIELLFLINNRLIRTQRTRELLFNLLTLTSKNKGGIDYV